MQKEPYATGETAGVKWAIFKSLCGIPEPKSIAYGTLKPTCKKCIRIAKQQKKRTKNEAL